MFRDRRPAERRRGFALVEAIAVLALFAIISAGVTATFIAGSRLGRSAADRAEMLAAQSVAGTLVAWETRALDVRRDGFGLGPDSIAQRAFRGRAIVCAADSLQAEVRYTGLRAPDPTKDSLLVLVGRGAERAVPLASVDAGAMPCPTSPAETALALRPGSGLGPGDVLLIFERGSYHLSLAALRYRRGAGGRQPLTATVLFDDSTRFRAAIRPGPPPGDTVALDFSLSTRPVDPTGAPTRPTVLRIPLLNVAQPVDSVKP